MVVNPSPSIPDETLADALALMKRHGISGIPVVERGPNGSRASSSASSPTATCASPPIPTQPVAELMTKDRLITVREGVSQDEAQAAAAPAPHREAAGGRRRLPLRRPDHRQGHREGRCSSRTPPRTSRAACASPPRPASATTGFERAERLIDAGVDVIVVDTAHGHSRARARGRRRGSRSCRNAVQVIAGNVATARGRQGADRRRRRRGQGRHRPGLDLHHPHRRRRRRAAAHRHHGGGRGRARRRRAGDRRRRHQVSRATSPRRSPPAPTAP